MWIADHPKWGAAARLARVAGVWLWVVGLAAGRAGAHTVYVAVDNHTDYGWNATTDAYDASMLSELDYYLGRIAATAGRPAAEQARFNADCWWYLYLYQQYRTPAQFAALIAAMQTGHITVPLNPFVTLYGALPTEAAIRAGYYPGRIARQYGVGFLTAQEMENETVPWGMASLWAGSGARYSWKGICACTDQAPYTARSDEVFRWQGPDDKALLMKWYQYAGSGTWGHYAEANANFSTAGIQSTIDHFSARAPFVPLSGLFGAGGDAVSYQSTIAEDLAHSWNAAHPGGDQVVVSNEVDYFQQLEGYTGALATLRGGWGNDWDLWPAALAEVTASTRRGVEKVRSAEALAAVVHRYDASFWPPLQAALASAWVDYFKYFEHTWGNGGVGINYVLANKRTWATAFEDVVEQSTSGAATRLGQLFATPAGESRFAVFNPLGFARTDYADLAIADSGPYVVTDVASASAVPSQVITRGGAQYLRILASAVPSLGYRVYTYAPGTPAALPPAATITANRLESALYRVDVGGRGELSSAVDKTAGVELAGGALNDFGGGVSAGLISENVGPVSVTLRRDVSGVPARRVRVTLIQGVDRIEIEDEILQNTTALGLYRFPVNLAAPQLHFEEVGAIARPGLSSQGGDFLAGTRADFMTLNHFVALAGSGYTVTLSNWDAFAMRVGNSTPSSFDLPSATVSVLALGNPSYSDITSQGGDTYFLHRFALHGASGAYSGAEALRISLAHQNPLLAIPLPANQGGPLTTATQSFLSVSPPTVVLTAVKPAEEGERGVVVRAWELGGTATGFTLDASSFNPSEAHAVSLVETDTAPAALSAGVISGSIAANEITAYRFVPTGDDQVPGDNCPFTPNPGQEDGDGDGIGDACDMCTTRVSGQTNWSHPRIFVKGVADGVPGNDALNISGQFSMATGAFTIEPRAHGAQLEVRNAIGVPKLHISLPSGPYVSPGPGWLRSVDGSRYMFVDRHPGGSGGITKMFVSDKGSGEVSVLVRGRDTVPLVAADAPLAATIVLGGNASSTAGECGEVSFAAESCTISPTGSRIMCK